MATTNNQIIMECLTRGITEEVHTYSVWKSLGYQVKKGSKALFSTCIYKCVEKETERGTTKRMFPKNSSFFGLSQVEKVEKIATV